MKDLYDKSFGRYRYNIPNRNLDFDPPPINLDLLKNKNFLYKNIVNDDVLKDILYKSWYNKK